MTGSFDENATDSFLASVETELTLSSDTATKNFYAGILATVFVRYFELSIKRALKDCSLKSHSTNLNGNIRLRDLKKKHIPNICPSCARRFETEVDALEEEKIKSMKISVKSQYGVIVTRRHEFLHGENSHATLEEIKQAYQSSKLVIECLRKVTAQHAYACISKPEQAQKRPLIFLFYRKLWVRIFKKPN